MDQAEVSFESEFNESSRILETEISFKNESESNKSLDYID